MTRTAAPALVLLGVLAGCGGAPGPPNDASVDTFCAAYGSLESRFQEMPEEPDAARIAAELRAYARRLEKAGTPADIPEDARDGFEAALDLLGGVSDELSVEQLGELGRDAAADDKEALAALDEYATSTCPE